MEAQDAVAGWPPLSPPSSRLGMPLAASSLALLLRKLLLSFWLLPPRLQALRSPRRLQPHPPSPLIPPASPLTGPCRFQFQPQPMRLSPFLWGLLRP